MSNLVEYAKEELKRAGLFDKDSDYGGMIADAALDIVTKFSEQGHSGASAGLLTSVLQKLMRFEPLTPLTGEPDEWNECGAGEFQNRRCSHVFKGADGHAYDANAVVFEDADGSRFTNSESRRFITFPYTPEVKFVKR